MGPTGSGKTTLAMKLRRYLPIELISVDSALIYKYMDIGTAKPTNTQLLKHPHKLINFKDPLDIYSVVEFRNDALKSIQEILNIGKIPLLVGGTMFYYYVLLHGISTLPSSSAILRKRFLKYKKNNLIFLLHKYLSILDFESSQRIHYCDFYRIVRALEICLVTGKTHRVVHSNQNHTFLYNVLQFALIPPKNYLQYNIKNRFYGMLKQGFEDEVKKLFHRGDLNCELPSMRCIGYRQMWSYFSNRISYNDMVYQSILATNLLCKKQMNWLRKWENIHLLYACNIHDLVKEVLYHTSKIVN
uniref:tRNA (adenosine(37)-N6)-dimethylallyltransferase MiaA n=1 Tax=Buchnera aphidicola TaxID=9 RepID=UPI003F5D1DA8